MKPDQVKLDINSYYRCADVDGLRLEGAWATCSAEILAKLHVGERPCFRFRKDGSFTDEGAFAWVLKRYGDTIPNDAGSGTYEIKDFTLILHYTDGHVRQVAITGMMNADPASNDKVLFISRMAFPKLK